MLHVLRPAWLLLVLPWLGLVIYCWRTRHHASSWQKVCDPQLLPHLLVSQQNARRFPSGFLLAIAGLCAIVALAGPSWSQVSQRVYKKQISRVILFDLSPNMNAADLKPSRLVRAKYKLRDILAKTQEGSTGLIAFSAEPFVVTPLTQDNATLAAMLPALSPQMMPVAGSRLTPALKLAVQLLKQAEQSRGEILVVTASRVHAQDLQTVTALRKKGFTTSVLGVGTLDGAPVPTGRGFIKDKQGKVMMSVLAKKQLQTLAKQGGGLYTTITPDQKDIERLLKQEATGRLSWQAQKTQRAWQQWQDQGYWLLLLILPCVALLFRRGWLSWVLS